MRAALVALASGACAGGAWAQVAPPTAPPTGPAPAAGAPAPASPSEGRPVAAVRVEGLSRVEETFVRNQIRTREGDPFSDATVREDVRRLYRLGQFRSVDAFAEPVGADAVAVVFRLAEAPIVQDVQVVGNRRISDQDLATRVPISAGVPLDEYQLGRSVRNIEELYRNRGYYNVDVTVDQKELEESGIVLFRVREGERIRVTDIRFEGNRSFQPRDLRRDLNTKVAGLFERGPVDDEVLSRDVGAIVRFYRDRGHIDVRADYQVQPSPNGREAIITFLIDEGPLYALRSVRVINADGADAPLALTQQQIEGLLDVNPGDVYSVRRVQRSVESVRGAYWTLGYADVALRWEELRDPQEPVVDLRIVISEGSAYRTGEVVIQGNPITRQNVVRRELSVRPDRPLDRGRVQESETRLGNTGLFERPPEGPKATIQPEDRQNPGYRDVLVEVTETNTGSLGFGAAIGSDSGLIGSISLDQRNFDLLDTPESFDELIRGQAFRGAGQQFNLAIQPGTEIQTYSLSITDPQVFDSDFALGGQGFYRFREYDRYDEERFGGRGRLARSFGDRWIASLNARAEWVELSDIDPSAPTDVFAVADQNLITGLGIDLTRTTVPLGERFRPTRGTRLELGAEQVGIIGGDFNFTRLTAEHQIFLALWENFDGQKGVLSFKTRVGYIPQGQDEVPVYERFYLGGRSFRGFEFRTISPKGIRNDNGQPSNDPVGGAWMFFAGTEYEHPLWRDVVAGVLFIDSGTVTEDPGFEAYRVSGGVGLRLYIKQLGNAPLAFDFGFPIIKEDRDEEQLFSFSIDLPF